MGSKLKTSFLALFALSLFTAPVLAQNGSITGLVTAAETGRPVVSATVQAQSAGRVAASAITNSEGRYRITVAPGTYQVVVITVGYEETRGATVNVTAGGVATADVSLRVAVFVLNPVVVSVSKAPEKATDAPAHVEVVSERDIRERPAITPVDHVRTIPGIDVISSGVQSTNIVVRGFNNIFSGSLHALTDYRLASVPSLRVNVLHFVPSTSEDLQRIEVVLGPGAALYGPNTASGVLHMITKSPLTDQGTAVSVTGGERSIMHATLRTAHLLTDRIGFKLSGQLLRGNEWTFIDPDEVAERAKFAADPFFRQDLISSTGITPAEADRRIATIGARDNDLQRWSAEARLDWQATSDLTTIFQTGISHIGTGIELTGLGAAQADDWRYMYYQGRAHLGRAFAHLYYNTSNAGDTYLLRTGQPIVDESTLLVGQLQHGFRLASWQDFVYGADYFHTNPQTQGTINGIYEDDDQTTEIGAYLQSQTTLMRQLDLVLAGRIDDHSALPDPVFSPRAALVYKPIEDHALRATYNRAFSTPTSLNQFLDLPTSVPNQSRDPLAAAAARLGYSVRVQGTGTSGFRWRNAAGAFEMRSPFTPTSLGGSRTLLPATNAALFFPATVQVALARGAGAHPLMTPARINTLLTSQATPAQISANYISGTQSLPLSGLQLQDIAPIRETTTTTFELGYQGVIANRLKISADVWKTELEDFVTPLTVHRTLVALNPQEMGGFIVQRLVSAGGTSLQEAQALAAFLAPLLAQVPVGVVSSAQINATSAQFLATYTNVDETLDFTGLDLGAQLLLMDDWSLALTGSLVSDDHFDTSVGVVTLNAPKKKGSIGLQYRPAGGNFNGEVRARYHDEYPAKSGVYEGTACIEPAGTTAAPCVKSATLVDLSLGYSLPQFRGASLQLSVQNLLDDDYVSYPGAPIIGRLALLRLRYEF